MYRICIYTYIYMQIHVIYSFYIVAPEHHHERCEADAPHVDGLVVREALQSKEKPTWPIQDILLLRGCCARINHPFIPPRPPALPLVQYYCTMIGQCATPPPNSRL